jgi:hypothetical protein
MKTAHLNALTTLSAAMVLSISSSLAQASHYGEVGDHARDIYYAAGRADRVVRYNFRSAPLTIYSCLRDNLCGMVETATCIKDLTRHGGNLAQIQTHVEKLDDQFTEVQKGAEALQKWLSQCPAPGFGRYGSCSASRSRVDDFNLKRLCERIDELGKEMECMLGDLDKLLVDAGLNAPHSHGNRAPQNGRPTERRDFGPDSPPAPRPRLEIPPTPTRGAVHGRPGNGRPGHDRHPVQIPVFRHNGRSFSISLSF